MAAIRFACPPAHRDQAVVCLAASGEFSPTQPTRPRLPAPE